MFFIRNDLYDKLNLKNEHPFNNFIPKWLHIFNNISREYNYSVCN